MTSPDDDLAADILRLTGGDREAARKILQGAPRSEAVPIESCAEHHALLHADHVRLRAECDYQGFQPDEDGGGLHLWNHRACHSTITGPVP